MSPSDRPGKQCDLPEVPDGTLDRPPAEVVDCLNAIKRRLLDRIAERESKAADPQQDRSEP